MDTLFTAASGALRTLFAQPHATHACPTLPDEGTALSPSERRHAAGLMRVNHVGEVCAQALYTAQALSTRNPALRAQFTRWWKPNAKWVLTWTATWNCYPKMTTPRAPSWRRCATMNWPTPNLPKKLARWNCRSR